MSQVAVSFQALDDAIVSRVRVNAPARFGEINGGEVLRQLELAADETGRQSHLILESRLQALKKAGKLEFNDGWTVKQ